MAELLSIDSNSFFRVRRNVESADNATATGLYSYSGTQPINGQYYGLLLCLYNIEFTVTWSWGVQIFIGENTTISFRTSIRKNGVWGNWQQL